MRAGPGPPVYYSARQPSPHIIIHKYIFPHIKIFFFVNKTKCLRLGFILILN